MINHSKLVSAFERAVPDLWFSHESDREHAQELWAKLCKDTSLEEKKDTFLNAALPNWLEFPLAPIQNVSRSPLYYHVIAIDGSQIYPDRHEGIRCGVLNIACAHFDYDTPTSRLLLDSTPSIESTQEQEVGANELDCLRFLRELEQGLEYALKLKSNKPILVLIDGALIFWQISESPRLHKKFFAPYCKILQKYNEAQIPLAGYTSCPQSKELTGLVRTYGHLCGENPALRSVIDRDLFDKNLPPTYRTPFFGSNVTLARACEQNIKPVFFYLNTGHELARIEIPFWYAITLFDQQQELISEIILDQCTKGMGYPISLAHAHEHAVIKMRDREIFYHLIRQIYPALALSAKKSRKLKLFT